MKGLIYKDITILVKGTKPIYYLLFIIALVIFFVMGGEWGGGLSTILLSLYGGIFSTSTTMYDEKAWWRRHEVTLPTGRKKSILCKYIIALLVALLAAIAAILFFFINAFVIETLNWSILLFQISFAFLFPLIWNAVLLPLCYWIGHRVSSSIGIIVVYPVFLLINYFEDGPGVLPALDTLIQLILIGAVCTFVLLSLSYIFCTAIYKRKEYK